MSVIITLKKTFDMRGYMPIEATMLLAELSTETYRFALDERDIRIEVGQFGEIKEEKEYAEKYMPRAEPYPVKSVNISFPVDLESSYFKRKTIETIKDEYSKEWMTLGYRAFIRLLRCHRRVKHSMFRNTKQWLQPSTLLFPRLSEREFGSGLFLSIVADGQVFAMHIGEGKHLLITSDHVEKVSKKLHAELATKSKHTSILNLLIDAWDKFFRSDYNSALIGAAISIEIMLVRLVERDLLQKKVATKSRIGTYVEDVSNRLLCTVGLGVMGIADDKFREAIAKVFDVRNDVVHSNKKIDRETALGALTNAEGFLDLYLSIKQESGGLKD